MAEIEPLLMIRPPRGDWSRMIRNASCVHRNAPVRLVSTTAFHRSSVEVLERHGRRADAGVVDEQVEPAEPLADDGEQRARPTPGRETSHGTATASPPISAAAASSGVCAAGRRARR